MQPEPFPNHKITEIWRESKSRSPFFRSLLGGRSVSQGWILPFGITDSQATSRHNPSFGNGLVGLDHQQIGNWILFLDSKTLRETFLVVLRTWAAGRFVLQAARNRSEFRSSQV